MGNETLFDGARHAIALFAWKIYVLLYWTNNKSVQRNLTTDVAENLGYFLRESHPDFK